MLAFFFSTDVDSFNICQPSFAKVAMWIVIMADFLNENIHIIFALFYLFIFFRFCSLVVLTSFTKIPKV